MGCPELFFDPSRYRIDDIFGEKEFGKSMPSTAWSAICASDIDVRKELCRNIVLSGGSTMYEDLPDRFKSEIVAKAPTGA
jgi:actin, other eukaryote